MNWLSTLMRIWNELEEVMNLALRSRAALFVLTGISLAAIAALLFSPLPGVRDLATTFFVPVGVCIVLLVALTDIFDRRINAQDSN